MITLMNQWCMKLIEENNTTSGSSCSAFAMGRSPCNEQVLSNDAGNAYRGFAWQPCCMAGTMKMFCIRKNTFSHGKKNLLFLPCNMAAVQNLYRLTKRFSKIVFSGISDHSFHLVRPLREVIRYMGYRSFSRDVITFYNLKLKIHQSFHPHQV